MGDFHKASIYSFWRWEYIRRNKKYCAHFKSFNILCRLLGVEAIKYPSVNEAKEFRLEDLFVSHQSLDPLTFTELVFRMNYIVERFKTLPVPPVVGPSSIELLESAIRGDIDYNTCPTKFHPKFKLNDYNAKPVTSVSINQRHAEYDSIIAKDTYFSETSQENLREWRDAILNFELEHIPSKKFRDNGVPRATGLWLWDHVALSGEQNRDQETIRGAIRELYRIVPLMSSCGIGDIDESVSTNANPESTLRKITGYYYATLACIGRCEVDPIKG